MQTKILKILLILLFPLFCLGQNVQQKIKRADSLYRAKQYTQSYSIYQSLLAQNQYSPSMLLKMAYIQEGLGHQGLCLYYLNLYQHASDDHQAVTKMEELANKHRLEGYQSSDGSRFTHFLQKNSLRITGGLCTIIFLFFSLLFYQNRKGNSTVVAMLLLIFFSVFLFALANWGGKPSLAIISSGSTYLMSGPSAGASVTAILDEGHRLTVQGKKDVWLKVKWKDKDAYVKESNVLPIKL
jgi:ABC-type multidrug transport system fused ATPase/permease subunit